MISSSFFKSILYIFIIIKCLEKEVVKKVYGKGEEVIKEVLRR
jgi:hypothetical protein